METSLGLINRGLKLDNLNLIDKDHDTSKDIEIRPRPKIIRSSSKLIVVLLFLSGFFLVFQKEKKGKDSHKTHIQLIVPKKEARAYHPITTFNHKKLTWIHSALSAKRRNSEKYYRTTKKELQISHKTTLNLLAITLAAVPVVAKKSKENDADGQPKYETVEMNVLEDTHFWMIATYHIQDYLVSQPIQFTREAGNNGRAIWLSFYENLRVIGEIKSGGASVVVCVSGPQFDSCQTEKSKHICSLLEYGPKLNFWNVGIGSLAMITYNLDEECRLSAVMGLAMNQEEFDNWHQGNK